MRQHNLKPAIIFALNAGSTGYEESLLNGLGIHCKVLIGSYKKVTEYSYIADASDLDKLKSLLRETNQESVLYLDNQRNAYLLYALDNYTEQKYIGDWTEVSQQTALKEDAYTFDIETGKYYIVA